MPALLTSFAVVVLVAVVALLAVLRRGGGSDLVTSELRRVSAQEPSVEQTQSSPLGQGRAVADGLLDGMDAVLRQRVATLLAHNRRVQAIDAVRDATGCRLAEAKALVDRMADPKRPPIPPIPPVPPFAPAPQRPADGTPGVRPMRQFPPGYDLDPRRLRRPGSTSPSDPGEG